MDETAGKGDDREMLGLYEWYSTLDDQVFGNAASIASFPKVLPANNASDSRSVTEEPENQMGPYQAKLASEIVESLKNGSTSFPDYNNGTTSLRPGG